METMARLAAVFTAVLLMLMLSGEVQARHEMVELPGQRRCGTQLTTTLLLVCSGNTRMMHKKNHPDEDLWGEQGSETSTFPLRGRRYSRTLPLAGLLRRRRQAFEGIADECCKNPCTIDQIREYCF